MGQQLYEEPQWHFGAFDDGPVGGQPYLLGWVCKPHDCGDNELYVLFAPGARQAWGLLISGDKRSWLGRPDPAIQAAILSGVQ